MQRFPLASPWHERILLDNGRELLLRPIAPADAEPIRAGFPLLSAEEVRARYQHPIKALGEEYLYALTNPQPGRDFVLVVAEPLPPGDALIGATARLSRQPGTRIAEFAILVSHFIAGNGLGRLLMMKLIEHANHRRLDVGGLDEGRLDEGYLDEIRGDVLEDNVPMLKLAQGLGFRREAGEAAGSVRVRLQLRKTTHAELAVVRQVHPGLLSH